ncbi:MAG TPA: hypothetical protein DDW33_03300 [Ktedonobacter sp.]|jgi:hypothetical protein|nr:hypothetical protein [Ktedonobacter sp.]HAT44608.1 hypothetical protein [Ktedonobacter sp.]HBE24696.1 hypothetical protein [Ktedonobacter sp.]HCJ34934.1 hypothetical protein [Ktedonobacter sp.]HCP73541.1 hypothetical protein [Ktedonobacter sp.]
MNSDRLAQLTDAELVRWRFLYMHLAGIEENLAILHSIFSPGGPAPDGEDLAALQQTLKCELAKRTALKSV